MGLPRFGYLGFDWGDVYCRLPCYVKPLVRDVLFFWGLKQNPASCLCCVTHFWTSANPTVIALGILPWDTMGHTGVMSFRDISLIYLHSWSFDVIYMVKDVAIWGGLGTFLFKEVSFSGGTVKGVSTLRVSWWYPDILVCAVVDVCVLCADFAVLVSSPLSFLKLYKAAWHQQRPYKSVKAKQFSPLSCINPIRLINIIL